MNRPWSALLALPICGVSATDQAYTYDGLDRVANADQGTASDTTGLVTTQKFEQQWKLDQLGNWQEFNQDDNGDATWDLEQSRTHNEVNELTAIGLQSGGAGANWADPAFDAAGNMTTIPQPTSLTSSYAGKFDAWNRLVSLDSGSTASYEYDGLNRRIKRTEGSTTRHFYYNEDWQCLEERVTEAGSALKQFVWGAGYVDELVLRDRDADNNSGNGLEERLYALQDALYNITGLVNASGNVQERFSYTPYGESVVLNADMTVKSGGTGYTWEHRYTGRRLDPISGLQLNRNRYYHQQLGRWSSRDPIGYVASSMCLYEYCHSAALKYIDPRGEQIMPPTIPGHIPGMPVLPPKPTTPATSSPGPSAFPPTTVLNYGNYCGPNRAHGRCSMGKPIPPLKPLPIDQMDAACAEHDCCLATTDRWFNPCYHMPCNTDFCAKLIVIDCSKSINPDCAGYRARALALTCATQFVPIPLP